MNRRFHKMRNHASTVFQAGVSAADPYQAVKHSLTVDDQQLEIALDINDPSRKRIENWSAIHTIAIGKASCRMAEAAQEVIPEHLFATPGLAVTNYENEIPVNNFQVSGSGHPFPDEAGHNAAIRILNRVKKTRQNELVLVLISGGGSALLPFPAKGISLQEKIHTTELLLTSGATINQVNCVRKHLSQIKGGLLAKAAFPSSLHTLIISDVPNDDLSSVASGPTMADNSSFADAVAILKNKEIWKQLPQSVRTHLNKGCKGEIDETPDREDPIFKIARHTLIGSNRISLNAIQNAVQHLGYDCILYNSQLTGEARVEGEKLAQYVKILQQKGLDKALAIVAGGETTVTVTGTGCGGRNQEMALAFAVAAKKYALKDDWVFLSGGSDGRDGPTDAAGGIVDPDSLKHISKATELLDNNDAYTALKQSQDLLNTGSTGTNIADLQVLLIQPIS